MFGMKRLIIVLGVLALLGAVSFELEAQVVNKTAVVADANGTADGNNVDVPAEWWDKKFLNNSIVDWLIALGIALGAIVVARALYWAISNYVKKLTAKTESKLDDIVIDMIDEPLVVAGGAAGVWFGFTYLDFSVYGNADNWVSGLFSVVFTLIAAWLITRLFDSLVEEYIAPYLSETETELDDVLLPIIRRGLKIVIWLVDTDRGAGQRWV